MPRSRRPKTLLPGQSLISRYLTSSSGNSSIGSTRASLPDASPSFEPERSQINISSSSSDAAISSQVHDQFRTINTLLPSTPSQLPPEIRTLDPSTPITLDFYSKPARDLDTQSSPRVYRLPPIPSASIPTSPIPPLSRPDIEDSRRTLPKSSKQSTDHKTNDEPNLLDIPMSDDYYQDTIVIPRLHTKAENIYSPTNLENDTLMDDYDYAPLDHTDDYIQAPNDHLDKGNDHDLLQPFMDNTNYQPHADENYSPLPIKRDAAPFFVDEYKPLLRAPQPIDIPNDNAIPYPPDKDNLSLHDSHDTSSRSITSDDVSTSSYNDDSISSQTEVDQAAQAVFNILTGHAQSCDDQIHISDHTAHMTTEADNHHDLSATYSDNLLHHDLRRRHHVGLLSGQFPSNQGFPRASKGYPSKAQCTTLFEGSETGQEPIPNICLHMEEVSPATPNLSFDIDSFIGFPKTLGALRRGFRYTIAHANHLLLRSDIHIKRHVNYGERGRAVQLQEIPHLYLGSVDGLHQSTLYIFFPRLFNHKRKFKCLTTEIATRFTNHIMGTAIRENTTADRTQHIPPNQNVADLKAKAKAYEHQQQHEHSDRGLRNHMYHTLLGDDLHSMWERVQSLIASDDRPDFKDAFLLLNAKNLKMDYKVTGSLYTAMDNFENHLATILDFTLMGDMYHDIGTEICAPSPSKMTYSFDEPLEATVYCWKTCCLQSQYEMLKEEYFDGYAGVMSLYHTGFLRDTACMTLVPPRRSAVHLGGWLYAQWYGSVKEVSDAQANYPFSNPRLGELAIDSAVWMASTSRLGGQASNARTILEKNYQACKDRVFQSHKGYLNNSFGIRFEGRVSMAVFTAIKGLARDHEDQGHISSPLEEHPPCAWAISTEQWFGFMVGNYDKFIKILEVASVTSPAYGISSHRSLFLSAMLFCVQHFANCNLPRYSILWRDERTKNERTTRGFGFEKTIQQYGYGWLHPVIDWENLQFIPELEPNMAVVDWRLRKWYNNSHRLIQDADQMNTMCFEYLTAVHVNAKAQDEAITLSVHVCMREYRRDIFKLLRKDEAVLRDLDYRVDDIQFCHEAITLTFGRGPPNLVCGNKSAAQYPNDIFDWIWGNSLSYNRKHFQRLPYRVMLNKVEEALRGHKDIWARWLTKLSGEFMAYHWVIPYPDGNGTLISTAKKTGMRQWWSLIRCRGPEAWAWGRKEFISGYPKPYPRTLSMGLEDLKRHFKSLV